MSLVSVFIPCYNYGQYLDECVTSVLEQRDVDVEVLVIDDASTDASAEIAQRLAARDPRVEVRDHARNRGHIGTYNEGLDWVRGDYLLLLSADDKLVPGALARAVRVLDEHPSVGLVFGDVPQPGEEGTPLRTEGAPKIYPGHTWLKERFRSGYNIVPVPTAVVRTSVQRQAGHYLPDHPHAGDLEMWLRLAVFADVADLPTHQAIYRRHNENMSKSWYADGGVEDLVACRRAFDHIVTTYGDALPDADRLRALAHRACAVRMIGRASSVYASGRRRSDHVDSLVKLARQTDPSIRRSAIYAKFRLRQALGFGASASLARLRRPERAFGKNR